MHIRVEGWRELVAHEGLKGEFFFNCRTLGCSICAALYSRRIFKTFFSSEAAYVSTPIASPTANYRHHFGTL